MGYFPLKPLFPLGRVFLSPAAVALGIDLMHLLRRHQAGDWGQLCPEDLEANQNALATDDAILSEYQVALPAGGTASVGIMSEKGRNLTVVFVPGEPVSEGHCN